MFYIHPSERDPGQSRVQGLGALNRFRHYVNLDRYEDRFHAWCRAPKWTTVGSILDRWKQELAGPVR